MDQHSCMHSRYTAELQLVHSEHTLVLVLKRCLSLSASVVTCTESMWAIFGTMGLIP